MITKLPNTTKQANPRKVVFLDRDGTLNIDHGYVGTIDKWEWVPGAIEGLKLLQQAGYTLAIITNQSGIAQEKYTLENMLELHEFMVSELEKEGVTLATIAYCPHNRDSTCQCRKPNAGMAKEIEEEIGVIDYAHSWTIGDKEADVGFGKKAGTKTVLLTSRYWNPDEAGEKPDFVTESLLQAAKHITVA